MVLGSRLPETAAHAETTSCQNPDHDPISRRGRSMANETSKLDLPPHVLEYLHEQKTLTLATSSPVAMPHAATLVYVDDGQSLYVWTRPDSTTAQHISQNPVVSFAIDEYTSDWRETKGLPGNGNRHGLPGSAAVGPGGPPC